MLLLWLLFVGVFLDAVNKAAVASLVSINLTQNLYQHVQLELLHHIKSILIRRKMWKKMKPVGLTLR